MSGEVAVIEFGAVPRVAPKRPKTRAQCENGPRPCPWYGCKYHLGLDVEATGTIRFNLPSDGDRKTKRGKYFTEQRLGHLTPKTIKTIDDQLLTRFSETPTCALDVANDGGLSLDAVGSLLGVTRERTRQIELVAIRKLRKEAKRKEWAAMMREVAEE